MVMFFVFLVGLVLGAMVAWLWYSSRDDGRRERFDDVLDLEQDIIRAAMFSGGRVTALGVRSRRRFGVADIEDHLRFLHANGFCESELTADGQHVFVFRAFDDAPMRAMAIEKTIFLLARANHGVVDAGQLVRETELSYLEARRMLEGMAAQRICEPAGEPDVYRFFVTHERAAPQRLAPAREVGEPPAMLSVPGEENRFEVDAETGVASPRSDLSATER